MDGSGTEDEQEPAVKQPQKTPKTPEFEEEEQHSQKMSPGPVDKTQLVKSTSAASRTPVTFCTYILTPGVRTGKQWNLKA